jgi:hypothetical protein
MDSDGYMYMYVWIVIYDEMIKSIAISDQCLLIQVQEVHAPDPFGRWLAFGAFVGVCLSIVALQGSLFPSVDFYLELLEGVDYPLGSFGFSFRLGLLRHLSRVLSRSIPPFLTLLLDQEQGTD